jgi:ABC-type nickel/cobalt efflux system permease component RcnA
MLALMFAAVVAFIIGVSAIVPGVPGAGRTIAIAIAAGAFITIAIGAEVVLAIREIALNTRALLQRQAGVAPARRELVAPPRSDAAGATSFEDSGGW